MRARASLLLLIAFAAASCGTDDVRLEPAAADTTATSTTMSTTTTTTTTTTTSTTTTTTTLPPAPLALDGEGVPINGQAEAVLVTPTGWRVPILGRTENGWRVWTPCGRELDIAGGTRVEHVDIVLDPGHGGSEAGATGPNGLLEKDLNLMVAERAASRLEEAGYSVFLTRTLDVRVPIVTRAELALALDPIAFISIHHNGGIDAPSPTPGTEMYYQQDSADSRRLAGLLHEESIEALSAFDVDWVSTVDAGAMVRPNQEGGDFYGVLRRPAAVTSVLTEFAYLTNRAEAEWLATADAQNAIAGAVVDAVDRFVRSSDPGSGFSDDPFFRGWSGTGTGSTRDCVDPVLS